MVNERRNHWNRRNRCNFVCQCNYKCSPRCTSQESGEESISTYLRRLTTVRAADRLGPRFLLRWRPTWNLVGRRTAAAYRGHHNTLESCPMRSPIFANVLQTNGAEQVWCPRTQRNTRKSRSLKRDGTRGRSRILDDNRDFGLSVRASGGRSPHGPPNQGVPQGPMRPQICTIEGSALVYVIARPSQRPRDAASGVVRTELASVPVHDPCLSRLHDER